MALRLFVSVCAGFCVAILVLIASQFQPLTFDRCVPVVAVLLALAILLVSVWFPEPREEDQP